MSLLQGKSVPFLLEKKAAHMLGEEKYAASFLKLKEKVDLIIVLGGDGTFLHTAHHFIATNIPLLGINIGKLGFLTELETNVLTTALEYILEGNYQIEKRMLLEGKVKKRDSFNYFSHALNDLVISRGDMVQMIKIKLYINEELVNSYRADGLIVATPTGSTAYSLSAGGPLVNPQIKAILITPICPHTLNIRPMVISAQEKVKVQIAGKGIMKVSADGSKDCSLSSGDIIAINAAQEEIDIIKLPERTFYTILREKMG